MLLLFSVIVLPLLFLGFTLSIDLTTFFSESNHVQRVLDEAALHAYRTLPYKDEAPDAVEAYLRRHAPGRFGAPSLDGVTMTVHGDSIGLAYRGEQPLMFPQLFLSLARSSTSGVSLPVNVATRVRGTPHDVFIAFDASSTYLSPPIGGTSAWGSAVEWPTAQFFMSQPIFLPSAEADERVATQQCFNEAFNAVKASVYRAYEYFAAFDSDQVGLGVYPGGNRDLSTFRSVRVRSAPDAAPAGAGGEADFPMYNGLGGRDSFCAAAAESEVNSPHYRFPSPNVRLTSWEAPAGTPPVSMVLPPTHAPNPDYLPFVEARQAVWSTVTRDGAPATFDIVFRDALSSLLLAPTPPSRGSLGGKASKVLFFFAGDVPWIGGARWSPNSPSDTLLRQRFVEYRNEITTNFPAEDFELTVYYIVFNHVGQSSPPTAVVSPLTTTFQSLEIAGSKRIRTHVITLNSAGALESQVLPALLLNQRAAFIAG